jgi:hypothetical protein
MSSCSPTAASSADFLLAGHELVVDGVPVGLRDAEGVAEAEREVRVLMAGVADKRPAGAAGHAQEVR